MRLLVDLRPVQRYRRGGVGYYCTGLLEGMRRQESGIEFEYLIDPVLPDLPADPFPGKRHMSGRLGSLEGEYDFFFATNVFSTTNFANAWEFVAPAAVRRRSKMLVGLVHDLIPWIFPDQYLRDAGDRARYRELLEILPKFDHVFCNSGATRSDVLTHARVDSAKTTVIHGAAKMAPGRYQQEYRFSERECRAVYVGSADYRKNVRLAIEAFALAISSALIPSEAQFHVVVSGPNEERAALERLATEKGVGSSVIVSGHLDEKELQRLLATSRASVFPSLYEGLGMPVLESYGLGTPCFVADNSSLKELAPPECRFDAGSVEGIAQGFAAALTNEELCQRSLAWGREVDRRLDWRAVGGLAIRRLDQLLQAYGLIHTSPRLFLRCPKIECRKPWVILLERCLRRAPERFALVSEVVEDREFLVFLDRFGIPLFSDRFQRQSPRRIKGVGTIPLVAIGEDALALADGGGERPEGRGEAIVDERILFKVLLDWKRSRPCMND